VSDGLPVVSGAEAVRAFERAGYVVVRQRGSHVRLLHATDSSRAPLTIPLHRELDRGLLRSLLRVSGVSVDRFRALIET
jgi:predicted RNA binding protein YcfA (HicA-like mRNA interferase family)